MKLINYDGEKFTVADEAFLIRPVRELFLADKSKNHEKFWEMMSYMYFMIDPRSTYMYITNETDRANEIKMQEGLATTWEPDEKLKSAMDQYRAHVITTQSLLLGSMRNGMNSLCKFFDTVDLTAVDDHGKPLYPVQAVVAAMQKVPDLAKAFSDAEKALAKDFADEAKARGGIDKSIDEDD